MIRFAAMLCHDREPITDLPTPQYISEIHGANVCLFGTHLCIKPVPSGEGEGAGVHSTTDEVKKTTYFQKGMRKLLEKN